MRHRGWWIVAVLSVLVVVLWFMGRSSLTRGELLEGADRIHVPGWDEPWDATTSKPERTRMWLPLGAESNARHGVFLEVDTYPHALLAWWDLGRRSEEWYELGDNLSPGGSLELAHPADDIPSGLPVADERLLCAVGDANARCEAWLWDGRVGQHVIAVYITDESGLGQQAALGTVRQALVAIDSD